MVRPYYWHVTTEFHTKFSMPEVKYGYVAIKVYGHVNCDHETVCKPRKYDQKQLSCTAVGTRSFCMGIPYVKEEEKCRNCPRRGQFLHFSAPRADREREV